MEIYRVDSEYLRNYDKVMVHKSFVLNEEYSTTRFKNKDIYVQQFGSDFFNLVYAFCDMVAICNNKKVQVPKNSVLAVNKFVDFSMYPSGKNHGEIIGMVFKTELFGMINSRNTDFFDVLEAVTGTGKIRGLKCKDFYLINDDAGRLKAFFEEAEKEYRERNPQYLEIVKSIISSVLIHFSRSINLYRDKNVASDIVQKIVDYCELHYCEKLEISDVEKVFNYSGAYITKLFKKEVGITFAEYVRQKKIILASRRLEQTNDKICDIACDVGFMDRNYFCECFKKYIGVTPSVYRAEVRRAKPWFVGMGDIKAQRESLHQYTND